MSVGVVFSWSASGVRDCASRSKDAGGVCPGRVGHGVY